MSLPPQPNYPPSQYPPQPAYRPPFPQPVPAGGYPPRPAPTGPLSTARLLGAHAVLWPTALILMIVLYRPLEKWTLGALDGSGDLGARLRLSDWLIYTAPLLVGGALAAIFLRPGVLRLLVAAGFAGVTAALELGVIALLSSGHVDTRAVYNLVYAASLTAVCLGWLVIRGRPLARVLIGFGTLPLAWLTQYLHDKLIEQHAVQDILHIEFDLGVTVAVLLFCFSAVSLSVPAWLAAIGARSHVPAPARVGVPAPWGAVPTGAP